MLIDHIGYAVKNIDKAISDFRTLGFVFEDVIDDSDRNVKLCFGINSNYRIELVAPLNVEKESPVDLCLKKLGSTPYHICYISDNLEADIEALSQNKFKILIPPQKAVAFNGKRVAFMCKLAIGLLEIVER